MPINRGGGGGYGNYVQRRVADATRGRGDRLRDVLGQQANQPRFDDRGGGGDRRNRGTNTFGSATTTANGGSITTGNVNPEVKATISSQGGRAVADASGKNGGGERRPVSFATYADANNPIRSPAPRHDIPGFAAASQAWSGQAGQLFDQRNAAHREATDRHAQQMREYNDAVRAGASGNLGAPNAAGYGSRPGDKTNSGPGGGRDKAKAAAGAPPPPPGSRPVTTPETAPGNLAPGARGPVAGGGQGRGGQGQGRGGMNGYPMNDPHNSIDALLNDPGLAARIFGENSPVTGAMQTFMMSPNASGGFANWIQSQPQLLDTLRRAGIQV